MKHGASEREFQMSVDFSGLRKYFVFADNGSIDHEQTLDRVKRAFVTYESVMNISNEQISEAVNKVFDIHKGATITGVMTFIKRHLDITPDNCTFVEKQVVKFMKENIGEVGEAPFGSARGKNGGTWRWSDKAEDSKEVKNSLAWIEERDKSWFKPMIER